MRTKKVKKKEKKKKRFASKLAECCRDVQRHRSRGEEKKQIESGVMRLCALGLEKSFNPFSTNFSYLICHQNFLLYL